MPTKFLISIAISFALWAEYAFIRHLFNDSSHGVAALVITLATVLINKDNEPKAP